MFTEMARVDRSGNPVPFSLVFISLDLKKNTGGHIYVFGRKTPFVEAFLRQFKDAIFTESQVIKTVGKKKGKIINVSQANPLKTKNPNHDENKTMNFLILSSKQVRKVHPPLIQYFNELRVE
jgi:phage repressor protein C with HTH and peptisase S24 domain